MKKWPGSCLTRRQITSFDNQEKIIFFFYFKILNNFPSLSIQRTHEIGFRNGRRLGRNR